MHRRRDSNSGFRTELENLAGDAKGEGTSGRPTRPKVPMHWPGAHCLVVATKRGNSRGAKAAGHSRQDGVNGKPEELLVLMEGAGLLQGGTSRMNREVHVRICGRLGAKFPGPTRQQETEPCQTGLRRALRKQRLRMPPGDYRYCACSRLYSKCPERVSVCHRLIQQSRIRL